MAAAMRAYTESIEMAPNRPGSADPSWYGALRAGPLRRGAGRLQPRAELDPTIPLLFNNRGVTYLALKQPAQALADFEEALVLKPDYANAYYNRAAAYMALGRYRLATESYTRAIELNDRVALFYNSRGLSYAARDEHELAIEDYERALALDGDYVQAIGNRANAYANLGRIDEALADYDRVVTLDPEHYLAYAGCSEIHWCLATLRATLDASTVIGLQPEFHGGYALRACWPITSAASATKPARTTPARSS